MTNKVTRLGKFLLTGIVSTASLLAIAQTDVKTTPSLADSNASLLADENALPAKIHSFIRSANLTYPGSSSWYLKASFYRNSEESRQNEDGTFEQWWFSPVAWRLIVHEGGRDLEFIHKDGNTFSTNPDDDVPWVVQWVQQLIVEPAPATWFLNSKFNLTTRTIGSVDMTCIALTRNGISQRRYQPYQQDQCFDSENVLRLIDEESHISISRSGRKNFLNHTIATRIDATDRQGKLFSGEIMEIRTIPTNEENSDLMTNSLAKSNTQSAFFGDAVSQKDKWLRKVQPAYPASARKYYLEGTVVLHAIIGLDGSVESLDLITAPSKDIAQSSLAAVKQWAHDPLVVEGHAMRLDTIIEVNYKLNRKPPSFQ